VFRNQADPQFQLSSADRWSDGKSKSDCGRYASGKHIALFDKSWDKCLSLAEFSYNNSYEASLKMAPFDALYGRRCRTPLNWSEAGERTLFGPELVKDAEAKVQVIRENLKLAQMRRKSYHDKGTTPRQYEVGDYVYLKVFTHHRCTMVRC
jgi:hypothetical protein